MGDAHPHALFAEAVDGLLDGAAAARLEDHLERCPECAAALDEQRRAAALVRALPRPPMPVAVTLPSSSPEPLAPRGAGRFSRPRGWTVAAGTGLVAAAAAAAVAVSVHGRSGPAASTAAIPAPRATAAGSCATSAGFPAAGAGTPPGFGYSATVQDPGRPDQRLVLAVPSRSVVPGQSLLIYARVISEPLQGAVASGSGTGSPAFGSPVAGGPTASGSVGADAVSAPKSEAAPASEVPGPAREEPLHYAALPCVSLTDGTADTAPRAALAQPGGGSAGKAVSSAAPVLATAQPTFVVTADGQPVQILTVPANLARGSVVRLEARIPGDPSGLTATLAISVS